MEKKKYNLRSQKSDISQVKLGLHLSDDNEFVTNLLGQNHNMSHQDSDSSASDSELDCGQIMHDSDSDGAGPSGRSFNRLHVEKSDKVAHDSDFQETQTLVNQQILSQLTKISDRLSKLEDKPVKKTADKSKVKGSRVPKTHKSTSVNKTNSTHAEKSTPTVNTELSSQSDTAQIPSLEYIRANNQIQRSVEERIKELQQLAKSGMSENKIKSQRGGAVDVFVKHRVKWPHEHVLAGSQKERVSYDQLTMGQWMAGFCRTMRDENCIQNKDAMLDYLISLLDDSNDFSWSSAKACHAVLLCRMEQGEIKNYTQTDLIDRIRRAHAQGHTPSTQNFAKNSTKRDKTARTMICQFFNQGSCMHQATHETKGVIFKHVCNHCFTKNGKSFPHSETECKNKSKNAKNE